MVSFVGACHAKARPFDTRTVKLSQRSIFEQEGWEFVPSKQIKTIRMKKSKAHFVAFEDRIWALFAKMKFSYLNANNQFQIEYRPGLTKQIDVIAMDDETILVVECKSVAVRKKVSYQKDINELIGIKDWLRQSVQDITPGKQKVAFIFATNNAILGETDIKRLEEGGIIHFNNAVIEYWERLMSLLGPAAKYQLFGKLFAGQDIPNLPNRVPAIKGKMASGKTFYSFCIDPHCLLKMGFILHRSETNVDTSQAYQRLVNKTRLKEIGNYIDNGGCFPNSVIINIDIKRKELRFDQAGAIEHDSETSFGVLHLPKVYMSAFIIDGQHRLYGYSRTKSESNHTIPVVAFHNLPQDEQAKIFVDINHKQKSVPTNVLRSIMADFHWNAQDDNLAIAALKTRLVSMLNNDDSSPLYDRIVLVEQKRTDTRCLTLETILKWGLSSRTGYFGKLKGKQLIKSGYLTEVNHDETLKKSLIFFKRCFEYITEELHDQWEIGSGEGGFISMNIGVTSLLKTIDHILEYLTKYEGIKTEELSGFDLAEKVIPYLTPIVVFVDHLDRESMKKLRSYFGASAPDKVTMEFLNVIHNEFENFNPDGLNQWIKEHSGAFNQPSWELGHNHIEPMIHNFIIKILKEEYGERAWWAEGISRTIQKNCSEARIDGGSTEPDWNFLSTIHYREIIEKNWNLLGNYFTAPGQESIRRDKKLSWFVRFNLIRQRYSHPQRDIITEEEYKFLEELRDWLGNKLIE